jgi:hypothetical protein
MANLPVVSMPATEPLIDAKAAARILSTSSATARRKRFSAG